MSLKIRRKFFFVPALCLLFFMGQALVADYPTTIRTPRFSIVPDTYITDELPLSTILSYNTYVEHYYPHATRLSNASRTYNCHGYAWHVIEGGNNVWIGYYTATAEDIYWLDGSYIEVPESEATKVSYSGNHSAITTNVRDYYVSKWGRLPLMQHYKYYVPSSYGVPVKFYKKAPPPQPPEKPQILTLTCAGSNPLRVLALNKTPGCTYEWVAYGGSIISGQGEEEVYIQPNCSSSHLTIKLRTKKNCQYSDWATNTIPIDCSAETPQ